MTSEPRSRLPLASKAWVYFALVVLSIPALLPLLWMVSTSFKGSEQIFSGAEFSFKSLFPAPVVTTNYPQALHNMPFLLYLRNTLASGVQQFVSHYGGFYAQLMAAATIFTLPIIVLFFFAQKTFIQGIAKTGGKN